MDTAHKWTSLATCLPTACPSGTYKPEASPGGISTCIPCPDENHTSPPGSTSPEDCVCREGYQTSGQTCQGKPSTASKQEVESWPWSLWWEERWLYSIHLVWSSTSLSLVTLRGGGGGGTVICLYYVPFISTKHIGILLQRMVLRSQEQCDCRNYDLVLRNEEYCNFNNEFEQQKSLSWPWEFSNSFFKKVCL